MASSKAITEESADRCRLILDLSRATVTSRAVEQVLAGGDVAAALLSVAQADLVAAIQAYDCAALIIDDAVAAERAGADGLLLQSAGGDLRAIVARFSPHGTIGYAARDRHGAMLAGEAGVDLLMFGKAGGDTRSPSHPRNLALARWWAQLMEIPCAVVAGAAPESTVDAADTGAEFVVAGRAVFEAQCDAGAAVARINGLLDEHARHSPK